MRTLTRMQFTELDLHPDLQRGIADLGFTDCTDVQAETLTRTLHGRDVAVQSQTGTGKTAAFLITIYQLMNTSPDYRDARALIVAPTRELAVQIENDAKALGKYLPQRTGCFYGGVGYGQQERDLADNVEIVIGTPGRLLDFNQSGRLDFRAMKILVIDEADRLFDMGFYPDIRKMMRRALPRTERLTMLYSATLSVSVRNISWQFMNDPQEIEIRPEQMTVETVHQELYHVSKDEKFSLLLGLLKRESPRNAIIFCNTKRATEIIAKKLELNGYHCDFIIGDLPQKKRLAIIDRIKSGDTGLLTATDVAARGLHVDDLDLVVNYDLPEDAEAYVHRIGRTARAGKNGKAIALACERFVYSLEPIEKLIGKRIPSVQVTEDMLAKDESEGKPLPSTPGLERPARGRAAGRPGGGRNRPAPRERSAPAHHPHGPRHAAADAGAEVASRRGRTGSRSRRGPAGPVARDRGPVPSSTAPGQRSEGTGERGPSRESTVDERLAYYRKKYGEDFAGASAANSGTDGRSAERPQSSQRQRPSPVTSDTRDIGGDRSAEPAARGRGPAASDPEPASSAAKPAGPQKEGLLGRLTGMFKRKR